MYQAVCNVAIRPRFLQLNELTKGLTNLAMKYIEKFGIIDSRFYRNSFP